MSRVFLATVFAAGVSSAAIADDSSISRFGGDSYAFLNRQVKQSRNSWLQTNPRGVSERALQAESASSASPAWQLDKPVYPRVASDPSFRQTHPNGLTERELRALSSDAPAWH